MGGRGARSGISENKNEYGSQYKILSESGNIKFVSKMTRQSEDLMETMADGRIYATVGGKDVIRITTFDVAKKRNKVIEKDKRSSTWHVHYGYNHSEYGEHVHNPLTATDKRLLDKVLRLWHNRK